MILGQEKTSRLGLKGQMPDKIDLPNSTLHNQASTINSPNLNTLKFLKFQKNLVASRLDPSFPISKYIDHLPK